MTSGDQKQLEQRVVILAPTRRDAALTESILLQAGIACLCCDTLPEVCDQLDAGAAAVLVAEERILGERDDCLVAWLNRQPAWSDLPILVAARPGADSAAVAQAMDLLGNVTVLERPTRVATLVSAIRTALRARQRQYQLRAQLAERQRAADEALRNQEIFKLVHGIGKIGHWDWNIQSDENKWSPEIEALYGLPPGGFAGTYEAWAKLIHPDDLVKAKQDVQRALETGVYFTEFRVIWPDGSVHWLEARANVLLDEHGKPTRIMGVNMDVTDRKRVEEALKDAGRRKDEFLATLAHELRNPLAPIRNSLHILRMTAGDDPTSERVCEMMDRQVNHLVRLVDDLMEVSRITRGLIELRKEEVDLATILRSAVETSKPLIAAANHQLAITLPPEPIALYGDSVRLAQVFANLLNNAARYTDRQGQIWLSARREGNQAMVSVRDNGIGIPPSMLSNIFDMFMQADRSAARSQGGLGIGLTLVKRLVEMHGGTISVQSAGPGQGSEFTVRLPVSELQPHQTLQPPATPGVSGLPQRRVLVVDDNEDAAASMGMLLRFLGTQVQVVHSGEAALEAIEANRPDVVLLDIGMPGLDGYEVAKRVRQRADFNNIMLIALTGWGQSDDRDRTRKAGFDYHLVKPADITVLQSLLTAAGE
ncbi:MAG TPA: ATP-binding protein [Pirellulales bacterium]|nr:ATP-binding protein [Pirellulales bacterium]